MRRGVESGLTIVDVAIGIVLLAVVLAVLAATLGTGAGAARGTAAMGEAERDAFRTLDRIAAAVCYAGRETLVPDAAPPLGSERLTYQVLASCDAGVRQWGPAAVIEWREDPSDPTDGADNNGNGLIDEGIVVWTRDPGGPNEKFAVLARGVAARLEGEEVNGADDNGNGLADEKGLSFAREGDLLTIRLTVVRRGEDARVVTRTVETSVALRN